MKLNLNLHHISSGRWSTELIFSSFEWGGVTGVWSARPMASDERSWNKRGNLQKNSKVGRWKSM